MKKTKLFTSIAALALVLGLGACELPEETTSDESGLTTETDTTVETDTGSESTTSENTSEDETSESTSEGGNEPVAYAIVGDFPDNAWNESPATDSVCYIPAETEKYEVEVTIADKGTNTWDAGLRVVEYGTWTTAVGYTELDSASTGVWQGSKDNNIAVNWGATYDLVITLGETPSILVTLQTEEGGNEGDDQEEGGTTYKLGALDSTEYCYRYFNGATTGTTFLNTTTEWDSAVEVYITAVDDEIENSCTLSFIDADGSTKYISNNSSTSVTLADDPCVWVWVDSLEVFAQGSSSGRVLVLYTDGSFRGYAQTDTNLAYPHVHAYTEAQENPEAPEVTTTYEQVSSLGDGGQFYAGGYSSSTLYLTTGSISGYNFPTSQDLDSCVPFTVAGNATDGYTLTCSDGKYVYAYDTGSYYDFGTSNAATVPDSGTNIFYWNDAASTLYCNGSDVRTTARYTYVYFEFYSGNVCAYGTNTLNASTNNLAHFYQQVTA